MGSLCLKPLSFHYTTVHGSPDQSLGEDVICVFRDLQRAVVLEKTPENPLEC